MATVLRAAPAPRPSGVVLFGNPNVGKSALFGALTGTYVTVSNYPGTTVEVARGAAPIGGEKVALVDTPGTASFLPSSEDERVARDLLLEEPPAAAVLVADAKNLERALLLAVELAEIGLPFALCLNMVDEAEARGLAVDAAALAARLGVDVVPTVAVRRRGTARLLSALAQARPAALDVRYPAEVERGIAAIAALLPPAAISARALATMVLCGDDTLAPWLRARLDTAALARLDDVREDVRRALGGDAAAAVQQARRRTASRLAREALRPRTAPSAPRRTADRLERLSTHRVLGLPLLAAVLYLTYLFVGVLGAGTLVDLLEERLFGGVINPAVTALAQAFLPWAAARDLVVGPYGLVTMGLTYALALVLPIVGTFFLAFGALEDSGYLPRLAVMVNRVFRKMGLNGKAVLPMVLGLGCDTMATLTTRILETRKERVIVTLLLALGVPCSAQLAVVLGLLGPLPAAALWIWAGVVGGVIVLVGRLAARVVPGHGSDFVLELPPLRLPRLGNILLKTAARVEWYLKEAVPLFLLGTLILFVADRLRLLGVLERVGEPVVTRALGLPPETASAFLIGFLRRDFGAAGLYRLAQEGRLDAVQVLVAAVTITLFLPCVANFFMIAKERGWRTAWTVAAVITPLAVAVGAALNAALRALPGVLG
ncbi:MAG TPA: ferrous iron transport protein B [Vicinamibacteria bacterium]